MRTNKQKKEKNQKEKKEPLSKELYRILACPECKGDVKYNKAKTTLLCGKCRENYAIKDGIPVMLPKAMRQ